MNYYQSVPTFWEIDQIITPALGLFHLTTPANDYINSCTTHMHPQSYDQDWLIGLLFKSELC